MLRSHDVGKRIHVLFDQLLETEHDARADQRRRGRPFRKGFGRDLHGRVDLRLARQGDLGLDLAGRRIEHIAETAAIAGDFLAADKMIDRAHLPHLSVLDWASAPSG